MPKLGYMLPGEVKVPKGLVTGNRSPKEVEQRYTWPKYQEEDLNK